MVGVVVGMLGFGVVGGGTVKLLENVEGLRFKKILVRDLQKVRSAGTPKGCQLTTTFQDILDDPEINLVIEVMGGTDLAWTATEGALSKGKHVVTANKALISKFMPRLLDLLKKQPRTMFMYEAAVCGGIPIVAAIQRSMIRDQVCKIKGIMNGTTNFMLTKMIKEGSSYTESLADATARGYAEADPSADVLGWDARSKLCILAKLAYGCTVDETIVYTQGVGCVGTEDVQFAKDIDCCIKLMGMSELVPSEDGPGSLEISCSPVLVPVNSRLGAVEWVTNAVEIHSKNLDVATFTGPGAGELPSANSVVNDVLSVVRHLEAPRTALPPFSAPRGVTVKEGFRSKFYFRTSVKDRKEFTASIKRLLREVHEIELGKLIPGPTEGPGPVALITEMCDLNEMLTLRSAMEDPESTIFFRCDC